MFIIFVRSSYKFNEKKNKVFRILKEILDVIVFEIGLKILISF